MTFRKTPRITAVAIQNPDTWPAVARLNRLASQLATRDQPPAIDRSFGGSILPALQEIADATARELEELGVRFRTALRSAQTSMGRKAFATAYAEAEYSDRLREAFSAESTQRAARNLLVATDPERELSRRAAKLLIIGIFLFMGALTEGLLAAPVGNALGMPGTEIRITQVALASLLTLGSVFSGWLAGHTLHGPLDRRIIAGLGATSLVAALLLIQMRLAPIRGDIVAGNIASILNSAAHGHIKVVTASARLATQLFMALGRFVVLLGTAEGYILHDPLTSAYRRLSRATARSRTAVTRSRIAVTIQHAEDMINSVAYQQHKATWITAAHSLQAAGSAAMSRYLGEVSAHADPDTRGALYEARRPPIPLPNWVLADAPTVDTMPTTPKDQPALP
jgi:hypothetical protein